MNFLNNVIEKALVSAPCLSILYLSVKTYEESTKSKLFFEFQILRHFAIESNYQCVIIITALVNISIGSHFEQLP